MLTKTPPEGFSDWALAVWTTLIAKHSWEEHEVVVFERALRWWDTSDAAAVAAKTATGAEMMRLTKLSLDASTAALRHWRALKFEPARTRETAGASLRCELEQGTKGGRQCLRPKTATSPRFHLPCGTTSRAARLIPPWLAIGRCTRRCMGRSDSSREELAEWDSEAALEPYRRALEVGSE